MTATFSPASIDKMMILLLTFYLCLALVDAAPNEGSSPLVDYRFSCNEDGRPNVDSSRSSFLGDLVGINSTRCDYANNGVFSHTLVKSTSQIALMRQFFLATNASGLALEVWITPTVTDDDLSVWFPILVIGDNHSQEDNNDDFDACQNNDLTLGLRGDLLEIRFASNDPQQPCQTLLVRQKPLVNKELVQIVLTFNEDDASVYFNGESILAQVASGLMTNLTMWNPNSTLRLFSNRNMTNSVVASGSLHKLSIYDRDFTADQIGWAYEQERRGKQEALVGLEPLHLVASADSVTVVQGRPSPIDLGGLNRSTADFSVQLEITSLPRFGHIIGDDGPIADVGSRVPLPFASKKASLFYRSWSDDLFTSPRASYSGEDLNLTPEVLGYRLVALDRKDGALLGWSDEVKKEITIRHVNHPPTLVLPKTAIVSADKALGVTARPIAMVGGVSLDDPDRNVDRVRVDILALNGTLAIQNYRDLADFDPRTVPGQPAWQCHGDPDGSTSMTFLAEPTSASLILSSAKYEGFYWNQEDSIVIRIYDGSGGPCLEDSEHKYNSIRDSCFEIVATITVPAIAPSHEATKIKTVWLVFLILSMPVGLVLLYLKKSMGQSGIKGLPSQGLEHEIHDLPTEDIVEMV